VTRAPATAARTDNDRRMFGFLREIRAECQYLQNFIADTLKRASPIAADSRAAYISKALRADLLGRVDQAVTQQLAAVKSLFDIDAQEFEWCADDVALITLKWSETKDLWLGIVGGYEADALASQIDDALDQIVYECASLSFSPRVNDILCNLRIGQPLDVEFEFGVEFPKNPELRKRLLLELAQEATVLTYGIVDVDQGVIIKVATSRVAQLRSAWHLLGWLLVGAIIPIALAFGDRVLDGWPLKFTDLERLLVNYVLILIGSGAHLAIDALKAAKAKTRPSFQAIDDWVLWLHVHESQTRNGIFYIWVGYILLSVGIPKLDWSSPSLPDTVSTV
jgi:hypothetical protein